MFYNGYLHPISVNVAALCMETAGVLLCFWYLICGAPRTRNFVGSQTTVGRTRDRQEPSCVYAV